MSEMEIVETHPLIEKILGNWKTQIGENYDGYRGHVLRVFNCCLALRDCSEQEVEKLAIAAAFHDIGLWSAHTVDYLPPSVDEARKWLVENGRPEWSREISLMIYMHHKVRPYRDSSYPLVELFRKADLVDFSRGMFKFGIPSRFLSQLKAEIPNAGFHQFLLSGAKDWFKKHPLSPPPFVKW